MTNTKFEEIIQRIFEATGLNSQNELAMVLKINRSAITQAKNRGEIPENWIWRLADRYGLSSGWLKTGEGQPFQSRTAGPEADFLEVPFVKARLSAGGGSFEVAHQIDDFFLFKKEWLANKGSPQQMVLMSITGNSMEPELRDGDTVLIDRSQTDILAGAVYAIGIEDVIMVKRIEKMPDTLVLRSDNPRYDPILIHSDEAEKVRIIGKVVWFCRNYH